MGPLQGRRRRRHSVPHDSRQRHAGVFHARLGAQREGRSTASGRTTTSTTWIGCCGSSRPRGSTCRSPRSCTKAGAEVGIIGYGTSHWAIDESREQLEREFGLRTGYLRLRGYPFTTELDEFIDRYQRIYVVEQNRDAQMLGLMRLDCVPERVARLRSVLHYSGLPIDARSVTDSIEEQEGLSVRAMPARWSQRSAKKRLRLERGAGTSAGVGRRPAAERAKKMTTTATPEPGKKINRIGLEMALYRGGKTTLCAGCGHNA